MGRMGLLITGVRDALKTANEGVVSCGEDNVVTDDAVTGTFV